MARIALVLVSILVAASALPTLSGCAVGAPEADFTASLTSGILPIKIAFTDHTTGDVSAWAWDFDGDMQIDTTTQNPEYTYVMPGIYTVTLRATGQGGTALETKQGYITVLPPADSIAAVSPNTGRCSETLDVVVTGVAFGESTSLSLGNGVIVNSVTVDSSTQLTANVSIDASASPGPRNVEVMLSAGSSRMANGFAVRIPEAPIIAGIDPSSADQAARPDLVISGANFDLVSYVSLGEGITVDSFTVDSASRITASVTVASTSPPTVRQVTVANPGGNGTLPAAFEVTVPRSPLLTGASPKFGSLGQTMDVSILGDSLWGASAVSFRSGTGVTVDSFSVDSRTQLTASIYIYVTATLGKRDISVTTPGGTATLLQGFEVIGVSPSSGSRGRALSVVVTSNDLAGTTAVSFGEDIDVSSFSVETPTQMTANIAISASATPGPRDISIVTAAGADRVIGSFTVSYPTCTAAFVSDRTTGSGATTVRFTDQSTGDITHWAWDLNGDGRVNSTEQNPTFTYSRNGTYSVTLTVSGPYSEDTITKPGCIRITGCST